MANQYVRLLDARPLSANLTCDREKVLDLGAYRILVVDPRVQVTGQGNLILETSAVNEEGTWRTILTVALNAPAGMSEVVTFLRYVRWRTDNNVTGSPNVVVDIVAKQG